MDKANETSLSYVLKSIIPMMEAFGVGMFSADSVWSMVLGVLPKGESERDKNMMEFSRKDSTEHKVDNINQITSLAKLITQRHDYSISNLTGFTYAIRQLDRYAWDDNVAISSLTDLKDNYISFITSYYHVSLTLGKKKEAFNTIKYFGEEILQEDTELSTRLAKISSYQMLN